MLPIDLIYGQTPETHSHSSDYVVMLVDKIEGVHKIARDKLTISREKQKRSYDIKDGEKVQSSFLRDNYSIWYYCLVKNGLSPKLWTKWHGPCEIKTHVSNHLYETETTTTLHRAHRKMVVHCNKLRPYTSESNDQEPSENPKNDDPVEAIPDNVTLEMQGLDSTSLSYKSKSGLAIKKPQWYMELQIIQDFFPLCLYFQMSYQQHNQRYPGHQPPGPPFVCPFFPFWHYGRDGLKEHLAREHIFQPVPAPIPQLTPPQYRPPRPESSTSKPPTQSRFPCRNQDEGCPFIGTKAAALAMHLKSHNQPPKRNPN